MELTELYQLLELPKVVITELNKYENDRKININTDLRKHLLTRGLWQ